MKTPNQTRGILKVSSRNLFFLLSLLFLGLSSCDDDKNYSRSDFLIVSETQNKEDQTSTVFCKMTGGLDTLYIFSNVEYDFFFQRAEDEDDWIKIVSQDYISDIEATRLIFEIEPLEKHDLRRRFGSLSFVHKENYLGQFIKLHQGFYTRVSDDFTWLRYGTTAPYDESNEKLIGNWTDVEKEKGWTSTIFEGEEVAYVYGKNGYLKLGSETKNADLITPFMTDAAKDSLYLVSFFAAPYISKINNRPETNKLTVNILEGGQFLDGNTSKVFDISEFKYDFINDEGEEIRGWSLIQCYVVSGGKENPITGRTRIQIIPGDSNETEVEYKPKRLFIDVFATYIINKEFYYLAEENK